MNKLAVAMGIDPGKKGAIGYLTSGNYGGVIDLNIDTLHEDIKGIIKGVRPGCAICGLENQTQWGLSDKLQGNRLSNYLKDYGKIQMILEILGIGIIEVSARKWQSNLLGSVPTGKTKEASVDYACRIAPWLKDRLKSKTTGRADAICLAEYARQTWRLLGE